MAGHALPPSAQMMQFVTASWVSQCVGAAARLNLADHLASGPKTADELAQLSGANPDAVFRLMRALASLDVFAMNETRFSLTPLGETLRSGVPGSMRNIAIAETDTAHWLTWGHFTDAIKTGKKMVKAALQMEAWDYYGKHPEDAEQFSRAMTDISGLAIEPVLSSYDFSWVNKVVDVGGAHGALLGAVLHKVPQASGILFDLPQVTGGSKAAIDQAGLASRVEVVSGDFFKEVPAGADLYLLKHILHDWDDAHSVTILKNIRAGMKPTSKILIVEFALPNGADPTPAHFMDLNMLVMLDGRERTPEQYRALLERANLRLGRVVPTKSPIGLVEALPA
jgi:hypothetical protein